MFCSFFVIFSGFLYLFFPSLFFVIFFLFWDCRICCDHLNVGIFSSMLFSLSFLLPSFIFQVFFSFVSIFIFKEDNMFYIHFQRGSLQQWIRAKGSSKSFLTKAPTPPWHHWEQSTLFSIFLAFFFNLFYVYICVHHIRKLLFYHFI